VVKRSERAESSQVIQFQIPAGTEKKEGGKGFFFMEKHNTLFLVDGWLESSVSSFLPFPWQSL